MAASAAIMATEIATDSLGNAPDSIIVSAPDTVTEEPDPEWYVAPLVRELLRAPRRATAAACSIDSIQTYNADSVLESVAVYEYGDTTRTMTWTVNSDGTRIGTGRTEEGTNGNTTFTATYAWDNATGTWKGTTKEEHTFTGSKETLRTLYDWQNGAWSPKTKYTYTYDGANRELEFTTYERNAAGQLVYSKQRIREYNAAGKMTLDIQYTAHNGTDWSAGTKRIYDYDGNNTILNEYYSAYTNGAWVGSSKEMTTYVAGKKTNYVKQVWANSDWGNSLWEKWEFNGPSSKQTLHEKYSWANGAWAISLQENSGYDAAGNNNSVENYTYTNGVQKGSKKEEYVFIGSKKTETIKYTWVVASAAWVKSSKAINNVDAAGNVVETANYNWKNDVWEGAGIRTLSAFNSNKKPIEVIMQSWSTGIANWVNASRKTTEYSGAKTMQEAAYIWKDDVWEGTSRKDWHYNAAGLEDTIKTYRPTGTEWVDSLRTVNTYSGSTLVLTKDEKWITLESRWVMQTMKRWDISDVTADGIRQTVTAIWRCGSDTAWVGISNDTIRYSVSSGRVLYESHYPSWSTMTNDWVPSYRVETAYGAQENNVTYTRRDDWVGNKWQGHYLYLYEYDEIGQEIASEIYNGWSTETNNWIGSTKTQTTFNAAGYPVEVWNYSWGNNTWSLTSRTLLTYDGANNVIEQVTQNKSGDGWVNSLLYKKEYSGGQLVKSNNYEWANNSWRLTSQMEKTYDNDAQAKLRRDIYGIWYEGQMIVYTDKHYYYACDPRLYTIRFCNENGILLQSKQVMSGEVPEYTGETPTKQADAQYTYAFKGWDAAPVAVTGDATYTATFNSSVNKYIITFKNGDETLQSTEVDYGTMPTAPADPIKAATAQYTYTFKSWDKAIASVKGETTYTAIFDSTVNKYLITFKNDETTLQSTEVAYGVTPEYIGTTPVKQGDAQYTYTFKGWDIPIATVTKDTTYTATFSSTVNKYLVTFKNEDGAALKSETLDYGTMPTAPADPTRAATAQYTYTFKSWDNEIASVIGEATYTAIFDSTVNKYLITFKNDETTLQSTEVAYGVTPEYIGTTPVKQGDAQYTYTFKGWDIPIATVTKDTTYTATFSSTVNKYLVTFKNEDGAVLKSETLDYGAMPTAPTDPTKAATAQYTYAFAGWDKAIATVTGEATYTATYTETQKGYTITWLNDDGSLIEETIVEFGTAPAHASINKERTAQYTFVFKGWSPVLAPVSEDVTYTAVFDTIVNTYTVTFYFEDGITVLDQVTVAYGETPGTHLTPSEPMEEHYYYTFAGWSPEVVPVTGETSYTAVFTREPKDYTITFRNYDKTLLQTAVFPYGGTPVYSGEEPARKPNAQYTYTFAGWSPEIAAVTGDATYIARFDAELNSYTVKWLNEDGTELDRQTVEYGAMPVYDGETPTKEADDQYIYTFKGWTPAVVRVTRDATYRATYTSQDKSQALEDVQGNNAPCTKILRDNQIYILRGNKIYTLQGVEVEE